MYLYYIVSSLLYATDKPLFLHSTVKRIHILVHSIHVYLTFLVLFFCSWLDCIYLFFLIIVLCVRFRLSTACWHSVEP